MLGISQKTEIPKEKVQSAVAHERSRKRKRMQDTENVDVVKRTLKPAPRSPFGVMSPTSAIDLCTPERLTRTLLLDCRPLDDFYNTRMKFSHSAATSVYRSQQNEPDSVIAQITEKSEVVDYLEEHVPCLIWTLRQPGYFQHVIIYDQCSTKMDPSQPVQNMIHMMTLYNGGTGTKIHFLEGGLEAVVKDFPDWVVPPNGMHPISLPDLAPRKDTRGLDPLKPIRMEQVKDYLNMLDVTVAKTRQLLPLKRKLKSLMEEQDKLVTKMERKLYQSERKKRIDEKVSSVETKIEVAANAMTKVTQILEYVRMKLRETENLWDLQTEGKAASLWDLQYREQISARKKALLEAQHALAAETYLLVDNGKNMNN